MSDQRDQLDHAAAYREVRTRVFGLVENAAAADSAVGDVWVPACPEWRVHDLLAHLVGVASDVVAGRLEGIATDPWTARQVEERRGRSLARLLGEWEEQAPAFEQLLEGLPAEATGQAVFDAATHEQDLRNALGVPGARDSDAVAIGFDWIVAATGGRRGVALRLETEHGEFVSGEGEPVATVRAPRFELVRAVTGRRSLDQVEAFAWEPAPRADLLIVTPPFSYRAEPLVE